MPARVVAKCINSLKTGLRIILNTPTDKTIYSHGIYWIVGSNVILLADIWVKL